MKISPKAAPCAWAAFLAVSLAVAATAQAPHNFLAQAQAALDGAEVGDGLPAPWSLRDRGEWEVRVAEGPRPGSHAVAARRVAMGSLRISVPPSPRALERGRFYEISAWAKSVHPGGQVMLQYQTGAGGTAVRYPEIFPLGQEFERIAFCIHIPDEPGMETLALGSVMLFPGAAYPGSQDPRVEVEVVVGGLAMREVEEPDAYVPAPTYGEDPDPVQGLDAFMERQGVKPYDLFWLDEERRVMATRRLIFRDRAHGTQVWMIDDSPAADHAGTASVRSPWNANASLLHNRGLRVNPEGRTVRHSLLFNADFSQKQVGVAGDGPRGIQWYDRENPDVAYVRGRPGGSYHEVNVPEDTNRLLAEWEVCPGEVTYGLTRDGRYIFVDFPNRGIFVPFEHDPDKPIPTWILYDGRPLGPDGRPARAQVGATLANRSPVIYGHPEFGDLIALRTGLLIDRRTGEKKFAAAPLCGNENYLRAFHEGRVQFPSGEEWIQAGMPWFVEGVELPEHLSMEELRERWRYFPHATHGHSSASPDWRYIVVERGQGNYTTTVYRVACGTPVRRWDLSPSGADNYHIHWVKHPRFMVGWARGWSFTGYFRHVNANMVFQMFTDGTFQPIFDTKHRINSYYAGGDFSMQSPDMTKVHTATSMTGRFRHYIAVMARPRPPRELAWRADGAAVELAWAPSAYSRETKGYLVYRSERSGDGYRLLTPEPVMGTSWRDETVRPGQDYYYVATSLEHSGLESGYSEEAARAGVNLPADLNAPLVVYAEAEHAIRDLDTEDLPGLATGVDRWAASDWYYVYRHPEADSGEAELEVRVPAEGRYHVWARIRSAKPERAGWRLSIGEQRLAVGTNLQEWTWVRAGNAPVPLQAGRIAIGLATSDAAAQMDALCLAADANFAPQGPRPEDSTPPPAPANLRAENVRERVNRLAWERPDAPAFSHYQVHASTEPGFEPGQGTLIGSPTYEDFIDWGLRGGTEYHYAVTGVDRRGNESAPARVSQATPPAGHPPFEVELAFAEAELEGPFERSEADGLRGPAYVVPEEPENNRAVWRVNIPREGEYYLWLRHLLRGTVARGGHVTQRVNVRANGQRVAVLGGPTDLQAADLLVEEAHPLAARLWTWDRPGTVNLESAVLPAGEVELVLDGLAPGMRYDVLLITDEPSFFPQDGRLRGN